MNRLLPLLFGICFLSIAGCTSRVMWEYRDDPYLYAVADSSEAELLDMLGSLYDDDRQLAVRTLAYRSARLRAQGDAVQAERLVKILIQRYHQQRNSKFRQTCVRVAAPMCGKGSQSMQAFLRNRMAEGAWTVPAAWSYFQIRPADTFETLSPLIHHPSPAVRYEAGLMLVSLADPRGRAQVADLLAEMQKNTWPATLRGQPFREARTNLWMRARRVWPLYFSAPTRQSQPDQPPIPDFLRPSAPLPRPKSMQSSVSETS